jgi:Mn2+/Fe2+ NRAMP family transporter
MWFFHENTTVSLMTSVLFHVFMLLWGFSSVVQVTYKRNVVMPVVERMPMT